MTPRFPPLLADGSGAVAKILDPVTTPDWDAQVTRLAGATFFHGAAWAKTLQATYNYAPQYFVSSESGSIRALLPTMDVRSWLTGHRAVSLPFTDECAPLSADRTAFRNLLQGAVTHGREHGWSHIECRGGGEFADPAETAISYYGHRLPLEGGEEAIHARMESSVRRAVRKAEKCGLRFTRETSMEALRKFYHLQCITRRRFGLPPQPFAFFENLQRHVFAKDQGFVALAYAGEQAVAGGVFLHLGRSALYKYGASDMAFQNLRPNNLVMWETIRWFARQGFEMFDFGRTARENAGLRAFKLRWGSSEHTFDYLHVRCDGRKPNRHRDAGTGWHNTVFRHIPTAASRLIGKVLYKHMA